MDEISNHWFLIKKQGLNQDPCSQIRINPWETLEPNEGETQSMGVDFLTNTD